MWELAHNSLQEIIAKVSGIFQTSGQVGSLKLATLGVFAP